MHAPNLMPILSEGAHGSPKEGACIMEMASFLAGEEWSDRPACTHPVLARMAQVVNDRMSDSERGALLDLLPRLMGTAPTGTEDERQALSVGLAVWCAEQVIHMAGEAEPQAREAIRVARAWMVGEATEDECRNAAAAARVAAYNAAARAAYTATRTAAYAADAAYAATAATAHLAAANAAAYTDPALAGLLDEYDRLTERGPVAPLSSTDTQRLSVLTH